MPQLLRTMDTVLRVSSSEQNHNILKPVPNVINSPKSYLSGGIQRKSRLKWEL